MLKVRIPFMQKKLQLPTEIEMKQCADFWNWAKHFFL